MKKLTDFIEEKIAPPLLKFSQMRYIQVMQRMGLGVMSLLIIGSLFLIVASFPYDPYLEMLEALDLRWTIAAASGVGTAFLGLYSSITVAYGLTEWYNQNRGFSIDPLQTVVLSVASFLLLNPAETVQTIVEGQADPGSFTGVPTTYMGAIGVFTALIVGILTVEIYRFIVSKEIVIKLPENVPQNVSQAFVALIPSTLVIVFWWLVGHVAGINLPETIQSIFEPLVQVGDTEGAMLITVVINRLLWSVGIHGSNIVSSVAGTFWTQMVAANQEAYQEIGSMAASDLPYTWTSLLMDNYIWIGLAPMAFVMLFSKSTRIKSLGALALPAAIFNIGEPLIFGLPIMLNPVMMIPFILTYVVMAILSIIFVNLGLLPVPVLSIPWIMPAPLKTLLATNGQIWPMIYVFIGWILMGLIFLPFIKVLEKQDLEETKLEDRDMSVAEEDKQTAEQN